MPHVPLFVRKENEGKSGGGLYGDVIGEIDTGVGRILATLRRLELEKNTLVIFTSDNGPWLLYGDHAGSAGPLREGKATPFEGGFRVPCIMWWPGKIPAASECSELASTIDILPTIAALTGKPLPKGRKIDGLDVSGLWKGTAIKSPREEFLHYTSRGTIEGLRSGNWKLLVKKPRRNNTAKAQVFLFDLSKDVGEKNNLAEAKPDIVKNLRARMEALDAEIAENARQPWFKN